VKYWGRTGIGIFARLVKPSEIAELDRKREDLLRWREYDRPTQERRPDLVENARKRRMRSEEH
jgi:hypothetical protein